MKKTYVSASTRRVIFLIFSFAILTILFGCGNGSRSNYGSSSDPQYSGSVSLSWYAPTHNEDGSPLTDLGGYKIYYGTASRQYTSSVNVGIVTSCTISNLREGLYYFALVAYDLSGNESDYSREITRYIEEG